MHVVPKASARVATLELGVTVYNYLRLHSCMHGKGTSLSGYVGNYLFSIPICLIDKLT